MIKILGISWITENKFGTVHKELIGSYENSRDLYGQLKETGIVRRSMKNFGKLDQVSKNTCLAISLALFDMGISSTEEKMRNVGILSTNEKGCLDSNIKYFKDYVDCGRRLSRGNLFIYTLPSSPIADAAIAFGCQGPVAYFSFEKDQTNQIFDQGRMMIEQKEATDLLIVNSNEKEACCFYMKEQGPVVDKGLVPVETILHAIKDTNVLSEVIEKILQKGQE